VHVLCTSVQYLSVQAALVGGEVELEGMERRAERLPLLQFLPTKNYLFIYFTRLCIHLIYPCVYKRDSLLITRENICVHLCICIYQCIYHFIKF